MGNGNKGEMETHIKVLFFFLFKKVLLLEGV